MLANDRADVMLLDTGSAGYMANKMPNDIALAFTITTQFKVAVGINKSLPELRGATSTPCRSCRPMARRRR